MGGAEIAGEAKELEERTRKQGTTLLSSNLQHSSRLLERCCELAAGETDRVGAISAAAKLIQANAAAAGMLARLAQGETRHRSIVERAQPVAKDGDRLNSKNLTPREYVLRQEKYWRRLDEILNQAIKARTGEDPQAEDRVASVLRTVEEDKKRLGIGDELDAGTSRDRQ
jgi:hypothetical protein